MELMMSVGLSVNHQSNFILEDALMSTRWVRVLIFAALLLLPAAVTAQTKLLRFPDIHGDRVVFTYGGDLWTASTTGGTATRLTAHPGMEVFAKFSPDGKWIAFTGQYDGDEQVYIMPAGGGEPKQLTFYPARGPLPTRWGWDNQVYGWSRDGRSVIFRSLRDSWTLPVAHLYSVAINGGPAEQLPMPEAGSGDLSPDGSQIAYSPQFRDFRPRRRPAQATEPHQRRAEHRRLCAQPERRARALLRARRHLHRAGRARPDAQPDQLKRRARQVAALVARWLAHRLHL